MLNKKTAVGSALVKCAEAQQRFQYKVKGERHTNSTYNEGWQDALLLMEKVLTDLLPLEEKQIIDSCTFGMNKKGGKVEDATEYFSHYFQNEENV